MNIRKWIALCLGVVLVLLAGCGSKNKVSADSFVEAAQTAGMDAGVLGEDAYADDLASGASVSLIFQESEKVAKEVYNGVKTELELIAQDVDGAEVLSSSPSGARKFEVDTGELYGVVVRTGSGLIIGDSDTPEGKALIQKLLADLGL